MSLSVQRLPPALPLHRSCKTTDGAPPGALHVCASADHPCPVLLLFVSLPSFAMVSEYFLVCTCCATKAITATSMVTYHAQNLSHPREVVQMRANQHLHAIAHAILRSFPWCMAVASCLIVFYCHADGWANAGRMGPPAKMPVCCL